jgi:hypothetical protein
MLINLSFDRFKRVETRQNGQSIAAWLFTTGISHCILFFAMRMIHGTYKELTEDFFSAL